LGKVEISNLKIKFSCEDKKIKATTLLQSLLNLTQALDLINVYLNEVFGTNKKFEVKIGNLSQENLLVDLTLYLEDKEDSKEKTFGEKDILYFFVGMIALKRSLGITKPVSIKLINNKEIILENDKGKTLIINHDTFKLYNSNDGLHEKITNFFRILHEDRLLESILFKLNNKKFIEIARRSFPKLREKIKIEYLQDVQDLYKDGK